MFKDTFRGLIDDKCAGSQKRLSIDLNLPASTINKWFNGLSEPNSRQLIKLADYFGCTTDELLGRENYGTGNIEIIGEKLNRDEQDILNVYRALNADGKRAFLSMTKNLATLHNIGIKIS